jgi:uncharacterized protein
MFRAPIRDERPGPVNPSDRLDSIDALRGVALLGVLAINLVMEFRVSIFEQFLAVGRPASPLDRVVETVLMVTVDLKAFALFSLLFGVGLAIQFEHLSASPRRALLLFRRLIVLLLFGLIHLGLIWNGDILTEYALTGLIVLPFLYGPRWLLVGGAATFLAVYLAMQVWPPAGLFPSFGAIQRDVQEANQIYATGSFGEVLRFRLREIPLFVPLHIYMLPRTLGLFLFGAFVWRSSVLRKPHQMLLTSTAIGCIGLGTFLVLPGSSGAVSAMGIGKLATHLGTIVLALGYGALILAVANLASGKALLGWAAPLGRYRYGPVEWLWRTLMYGTVQPMSLAPLTRPI